jgi:MFS family permease
LRLSPAHLVALAAALALLGDSALYAVLPAEAGRLGLSGLEVGLLLSLNRVVRLLLNEPAGWLLRRRGPREALVLALVLAAATTLAYGRSTGASFALFLAARLVWGFAWSLVRHAANVTFLQAPPERRGATQGTFRSISRMGSLAAVLGGAWLVERAGFASGYTLLALATLPGVLLAALAFRHPATGAGAAPPPVAAAAPAQAGAPGPGLLGLTVAAALMGAAGTSLLAATASRRVQELVLAGAAPALFGVGLGVVMLGGIAGSGRWVAEILVAPLAGRLADRFGRQRGITAGAAVTTVALATCAGAGTTSGFIVSAALAFGALSVLQTALDTLATDRAQQGPSAVTRLGRYVTVSDAGTAVGPLLGSWLTDTGMGTEYAYAVAAAVFLGMGLYFARPGPGREPLPGRAA